MKLEGSGRLPPGRHACTMREMKDLFVNQAPNRDRREAILQAFISWREAIHRLIPSPQLLVDGGFVTHKLEPPSDLDVVILTRARDINALEQADQEELKSLLTYSDAQTKRRIQPMAGLVDAYIGLRGDPDQTAYWHNFWQRVKEDAAARKGYLVVMPDE